MTVKEIKETMQEVEEGDEVVWDNTEGDTRTRTQPVVEVTDSYFIVEGRRGGEYKFFKNSREPKLENLNMNREYTLARFEIE
jgi:hypothetical protein